MRCAGADARDGFVPASVLCHQNRGLLERRHHAETEVDRDVRDPLRSRTPQEGKRTNQLPRSVSGCRLVVNAAAKVLFGTLIDKELLGRKPILHKNQWQSTKLANV